MARPPRAGAQSTVALCVLLTATACIIGRCWGGPGDFLGTLALSHKQRGGGATLQVGGALYYVVPRANDDDGSGAGAGGAAAQGLDVYAFPAVPGAAAWLAFMQLPPDVAPPDCLAWNPNLARLLAVGGSDAAVTALALPSLNSSANITDARRLFSALPSPPAGAAAAGTAAATATAAAAAVVDACGFSVAANTLWVSLPGRGLYQVALDGTPAHPAALGGGASAWQLGGVAVSPAIAGADSLLLLFDNDTVVRRVAADGSVVSSFQPPPPPYQGTTLSSLACDAISLPGKTVVYSLSTQDASSILAWEAAPDACAVASFCVADTCNSLGRACGSTPDGCGGSLLCGDCSAGGELCSTSSCNAAGQCELRTRLCEDGNLCTADACNPTTGACQYVANVTCDDSDPCTADFCRPDTGACVHVPVDCSDGDECTDDACDPAAGGCTHQQRVCDDLRACTSDSCDSRAGCIFKTNCPAGQSCSQDGTCGDAACNLRPLEMCSLEDVCQRVGQAYGQFCHCVQDCSGGACSPLQGNPCGPMGECCCARADFRGRYGDACTSCSQGSYPGSKYCSQGTSPGSFLP